MMTTRLKVRHDDDPCLREMSAPVDEVGPGERMLLDSMVETMYQEKGIGLAAPQVGINKRLFVVDVGDGPIAFINPKIIKVSGSACIEEGCLSVPGRTVEIVRPEDISVEYTDYKNQPVKAELEGLLARVFLHENDHLDGKLILDYVTDENQMHYVSEENSPKSDGREII